MTKRSAHWQRSLPRVFCAALVATVPGCGTGGSGELSPQTVGAPLSATAEPPQLVAPDPRRTADEASPETESSTTPGASVAGSPPQLLPPSPHPEPTAPEAGVSEATTVWIGERKGGQSDLSSRLHKASVAERQRRTASAPPIAVIDDENLSEFAKDVKVTIGGAPAVQRSPADAADLAQLNPEQEQYWRSEALRLRLAWRDAFDEIPELEAEAARLRTDFYSADDPFYRDREIKPAWDRTLDRIEEAKRDVERYQVELEELMEKGRRAGALPGWLREGIEFEPAPEPEPEGLTEAAPAQPIIYEGEEDPP